MAVLEISNINKSFGGNLVLDNVSMKAELGKVTGLIGPNGAGGEIHSPEYRIRLFKSRLRQHFDERGKYSGETSL